MNLDGPRPAAYEGLVTRGIAFAIDAAVINLVALIVGVGVALVLSLFSLSETAKTIVVAAGGAGYLGWTVTYFVTFWSTTGQTPGNRLLRIRVCRADDTGVLRPRRCVLRLVGLMLAAAPLFAGFLPVLVDQRRRGLHDLLAGTVVVEADQGPWAMPVRGRSGGQHSKDRTSDLLLVRQGNVRPIRGRKAARSVESTAPGDAWDAADYRGCGLSDRVDLSVDLGFMPPSLPVVRRRGNGPGVHSAVVRPTHRGHVIGHEFRRA